MIRGQWGRVARGPRSAATKMIHQCPRVARKHSKNTVSVSVCHMVSILGPLVQLSVKLVLSSAFPVTLETHKEARNRSRLWDLCDLTVTSLPSLPLCSLSLFQAGAMPASLPSPRHAVGLFPSDCEDRKQRTERGNDLSSAPCLTPPSSADT